MKVKINKQTNNCKIECITQFHEVVWNHTFYLLCRITNRYNYLVWVSKQADPETQTSIQMVIKEALPGYLQSGGEIEKKSRQAHNFRKNHTGCCPALHISKTWKYKFCLGFYLKQRQVTWDFILPMHPSVLGSVQPGLCIWVEGLHLLSNRMLFLLSETKMTFLKSCSCGLLEAKAKLGEWIRNAPGDLKQYT
jgi:hypothetical protein